MIKKEDFEKMLLSIEKQLDVDILYIVSNGFWLLLAQSLNFILAFALTIFLSRNLPAESFGLYKFATTMLGTLLVFSIPGMNAASTRAISRGKAVNLDKILMSKIRFALYGSLITASLALYYQLTHNLNLRNIFIAMTLFLPFFDSFYIYSSYLKGYKKFKSLAKLNGISKIVQTISLVSVALIFKDVTTLFAVYASSFILIQAVIYIYIRQSQTYHHYKDKHDETASVIQYGRRLFKVNFLGHLFDNLDKILVWHFMGAKALAVYIILITIPLSLARFITPLSELILPKISGLVWTQIKLQKYFRNMRPAIALLMLVSILSSVLNSLLLPYLFPTYNIEHNLSVILAGVFVLLIPLNSWIHELLMSMKETGRYAGIMALSIVLETVFFYLFYVSGAGVGTALVTILLSRAVHILLMRNLSFISISNHQNGILTKFFKSGSDKQTLGMSRNNAE